MFSVSSEQQRAALTNWQAWLIFAYFLRQINFAYFAAGTLDLFLMHSWQPPASTSSPVLLLEGVLGSLVARFPFSNQALPAYACILGSLIARFPFSNQAPLAQACRHCAEVVLGRWLCFVPATLAHKHHQDRFHAPSRRSLTFPMAVDGSISSVSAGSSHLDTCIGWYLAWCSVRSLRAAFGCPDLAI